MRCEEDGCTCEATHSVTLNIPAVDVPIDCHQPMKMFIDVKLCQTHAKDYGKDFSWDENQELKDTIQRFTTEGHFGVRDFGRTFHSTVRLTDQSYLNFLVHLKEEKLV